MPIISCFIVVKRVSKKGCLRSYFGGYFRLELGPYLSAVIRPEKHIKKALKKPQDLLNNCPS